MNRYERRRQRALNRKYGVGDVLDIKYGRVVYVDPTVVDSCFVCGGKAGAWPYPNRPEGKLPMAHSFAFINNEVSLPLCEGCFNSEASHKELACKVIGDNMIIHEGGEASSEQIHEIANALKEREHSSEH
jgi:hypothetical protein